MSDIMHETGPGMDLEAKIRELAYVKWIEAGRPEGNGIDYWKEAEKELAQRDTPHPVQSREASAEESAEQAPAEDTSVPIGKSRS